MSLTDSIQPNSTTSRSAPVSASSLSIWQSGVGLVSWIAFCFLAASTGAFVSTGGWYAALNKPTWNPPNWIFGPVWTTLYFMMAFAAWLVWREGGWTKQWKPLSVFVLQWFLNALWTPLFFGLNLPGIAFLEIVCLWIAIVATVILFSQVRVLASVLLVPYLLWVSFAAFLNFTLWQLNS